MRDPIPSPGLRMREAPRRQLRFVLHRALLGGDYRTAVTTCRLLFRRGLHREYRRRLGRGVVAAVLEILRSDPLLEQQRMRFCRRAMEFEVTSDEKMILLHELASSLIESGRLQEAYDLLSSYSIREPYRQCSLIHGACGVLCYNMWRSDVSQRSRHTRHAISHFREALDLNPRGVVFSWCLSQLLLSTHDVEGARRVLEDACRYASHHDPSPHHFLASFLREHVPSNTKAQAVALLRLIDSDPCSTDAEDALMELYTHKAVNAPWLAAALCRRCDGTPADPVPWQRLATLLFDEAHQSDTQSGLILATVRQDGRPEYWMQFHFNLRRVAWEATQYGWDLLVAKAAVAHFLRGKGNDYTCKVQELLGYEEETGEGTSANDALQAFLVSK